MGRGRAGRPRQLVRVQRQLLRRPAAGRRRPPGRGEPRPAPGRARPPPGLADPPSRPARGRAEVRRARAAGLDPLPAAPGAARQRASRHRGGGADPARRPRHRRVQPPQLLRRHGGGHRARRHRALLPLPRQEGGVRRPGRRGARPDGRRHPGQPVVGLRRAARGRHQGAERGGGDRARPGGHDPAGTGLLRHRAARAMGRRPPCRRHTSAGHPGRAVGHGEGVAAQLPSATALDDRPPRDPGARRRCGPAPLPQRGRRHEADHGGAHGPAAPRGAGRHTSRRPRSWPPPTRPVTAATPASKTSAGPAPTRDPAETKGDPDGRSPAHHGTGP